MRKLVSWERLTGIRPTIESSRTIATVTSPLKFAIQLINVTNDNSVGKNVGNSVGKDVGKNIPIRQQQIIDLIKDNPCISMAKMAKAIIRLLRYP